MDHAGDVAWRLKLGAAIGGSEQVSKSTPDSGYQRNVFIVYSHGPKRVTVESVEYGDLTEEEDYLEPEDRESLLGFNRPETTIGERLDAYFQRGRTQRPARKPTHRLLPDGELEPLDEG